jgi:hypothetical protein
MSIIQFPMTLYRATQSWSQRRNDMEFRSMFGAQAVEVAPPLWEIEVAAPPISSVDNNSGQWQALLLQLRGRTNQLAVWNMGRPTPLGTMRGTMTASAASMGATSMTITAAGQGSKTLLAGDYLGVGAGVTQQVVMLTADATAVASGVITVSFEPALRNALSTGDVVTWDKPRALFRRTDSKAGWEYEPGIVKGMSMGLLEDWRL